MAIRKRPFGNVQEVLNARSLGSNLESMLDDLHKGWLQGLKGLGFQKQVLRKYGWDRERSIGIPGRRYSYDGFKDNVAVEIEWSQMERVLADLLKFQYGFNRHSVDLGIIVNLGDRSGRSPIDASESGGEREIEEMTKKIISVPILLVVFHQRSSA